MTRTRPIDPPDDPVAELAIGLNALHERSGKIPYRTMAQRARFSHTTLSRAAKGKALPTWEVTEAFVRACGDDPDKWLPRWEAARDRLRAMRWTAGEEPSSLGLTNPDPSQATTIEQFILILRSLKLNYDNLSYKEIAKRTNLPPSTVADAFDPKRRRLPSWQLVEAVLRALTRGDADLLDWHQAWTKIAAPALRPLPADDNTDPLLRQMRQTGLEGVYLTRGDALASFVRPLEQEIQSGTCGRLWIVGSSMKGFSVQVIGRFDGATMIHRALNAGCDVRLIFTHPTEADTRAEQEKRQFGAIYDEISLNLANLKEAGLKRQNVRFCKGAPTVFGICTSDRMLLNPYPYGSEAYLNFSLIVKRTPSADGIFERYMDKHFEKSWVNGEEIVQDEWDRYDNSGYRKNSKAGARRPRRSARMLNGRARQAGDRFDASPQ
ncbi:MAG: helix-turn-helix domain-containing protein [Pseudonocardiales bacterium]